MCHGENSFDFLVNDNGFFQVGRCYYDFAAGYFICFAYLPSSPPPVS